MFSYDNLYDRVFNKEIDADELVIITGYIGPAIVEDLMLLPFKTNIYVGMYGNNINGVLHNTLKSLTNEKVLINYTKTLVHSKCYIWLKNNVIVKALIGSANFSMNGLKTPFKEVLGDIPFNTYDELQIYLNLIRSDSYPVDEYKGEITPIYYIDENTKSINSKEVEISLLATRSGGAENLLGEITNPGEVHKAAGLNWGFSNGLSLPNDAYIKIPSQLIKENRLLFPPKRIDSNEYIDVIWDDGTKMQMLLEGTQTIDNVDYPKQISTYKNKKELGIYLRNRIGKKIGKDLIIPIESKEEFKKNVNLYRDKLIDKSMLERYGRSSINIKLIGEGTYYFDFSE